ncbi:MAG: MBL fold metallo-hydrolase [Rhodospirillales bacterium]
MQRAKPQDWYRVRRLSDGVSLIDEPFITPYYRCNMWHLRGRDRDLLIDSGMGVVSLRRWVPLVSEKPLLAVASHSHYDHIGCHHEFERRLIHPAEAAILAAPTRDNTLAESSVSDEIFTRLPPAPYESEVYGVTAAAATELIEEGAILDLGDRQLTVLHTPGHSPGGIALFEAASGLLFSGDLLYDGPLAEEGPGTDPQAYRTSMRRLLDLPVSAVHGGHFPSFGAERFRELITAWLKTKGEA